MFVMLNDGGMLENANLDMASRILIQRDFIFSLLTSGVAVALLHGAESRDSKVCRQFLIPVRTTICTCYRYFLS
jgi:ATP-dependent RNA helicase DDX60